MIHSPIAVFFYNFVHCGINHEQSCCANEKETNAQRCRSQRMRPSALAFARLNPWPPPTAIADVAGVASADALSPAHRGLASMSSLARFSSAAARPPTLLLRPHHQPCRHGLAVRACRAHFSRILAEPHAGF